MAFGPAVDVGVFAAPPQRYGSIAGGRRARASRRCSASLIALAWTNCCFVAAGARCRTTSARRHRDRRPERFTPFARVRPFNGRHHPRSETAMPTRRALLTLFAAAAATACTSPPAAGRRLARRPSDRRPRPRRDALDLAPSRQPATSPAARRSLRGPPDQPLGGRVLVVLSVDGVNAVSGETAAVGQTGYVLAPVPDAPRSPAGARAMPKRRRSTSPPCPIRTRREPAAPTTSA